MLRLSLMVVSFSINEVEISVNVLLTVQNHKLVMPLATQTTSTRSSKLFTELTSNKTQTYL